MITELRGINMHFHENAADYRAGDIVFLIEASKDLSTFFEVENGYTPIHAAIEAALYVRDNLNARARALFYGPQDGPKEINLGNPRSIEDPLAEMPHEGKHFEPAVRRMMEEYPAHGPGRPLHLIVVTNGKSDDNFSNLHNTLVDMLKKPGGQVLLDVLMVADMRGATPLDKRMAHVCGVAASKIVFGGQPLDPDKPVPNILIAHDLDSMQSALISAINQRISPENPEQFMLDKLCELVGSGTQSRIVCRRPASFTKKN